MYEVTIDNFNGPMDLLLHLIKKNEMNIFDLKLEVIIDGYLDYINKMQELNLDIASSYLVMASELIEIKSKMLLPRQEEDTEEEDPKENLINRIIEYQKYQEQIEVFKELESIRSEYYTKTPENINNFDTDKKVGIDNISLDDLVNAMKKFLERKELDKPLNTKVTKKELSVDDSIKSIKNKLKINKRIDFFELFETKTKEYVIVTFLAVLELCSRGEIKLIQEDNFDKIICEGL